MSLLRPWATVISNNSETFNVGSISRSIKMRYYEHKASFNNDTNIVKPRNCTELANYIWKPHNEGSEYEVN